MFKKKPKEPSVEKKPSEEGEELADILLNGLPEPDTEMHYSPDADASPQVTVYQGTTKEPLINVESYNVYDKKQVMELVSKNGVFLAAVPKNFHNDPKICAAAVRSDQFSILQVPLELRDNPEVQQAYESHRTIQRYKLKELDSTTAHILEIIAKSETPALEATADDIIKKEPEPVKDDDKAYTSDEEEEFRQSLYEKIQKKREMARQEETDTPSRSYSSRYDNPRYRNVDDSEKTNQL